MNVWNKRKCMLALIFFLLSFQIIFADSFNVCNTEISEPWFVVNDSDGNEVLIIDGEGDMYFMGIDHSTNNRNIHESIVFNDNIFFNSITSFFNKVYEKTNLPSSINSTIFKDNMGIEVITLLNNGDIYTRREAIYDGSQAGCLEDGFYCDNNTLQNINYFCDLTGARTGSCQNAILYSENCLTKVSTDTDGGNFKKIGGVVSDYTGCTGDECTFDSYADYCSDGINLVEYLANGASYSSINADCSDDDYQYCSDGIIYSVNHICETNACTDGITSWNYNCVQLPDSSSWTCDDIHTKKRTVTTYLPGCAADGLTCSFTSSTSNEYESCAGGEYCALGECEAIEDCQGYWNLDYGSCSASCGGGNYDKKWITTQNPTPLGSACPSPDFYNNGGNDCNTQSCCTPEDTKDCYNDDVYWYDSCGIRGNIYDDCTTSEYCNSGLCKPIIASGPAFIAIWNTANSGVSNSDQITLPLESSGNYNFLVKWGDGNEDIITSYNQAEITHTYASTGSYQVEIEGTIVGFRFNMGGDKEKITDIKQWGVLNVGNSGNYFAGCNNLRITASDALDLTGTTNLDYMFRDVNFFNQNINHWDVSNVESMYGLFLRAYDFNQPLNNWDTSSVTDMSGVFSRAESFNQPLNNWDVSNVETMFAMFSGAYAFNQPLYNWDVSRVTDMMCMFDGTSSFNQNINNWDTSSVTTMEILFLDAHNFNQPLYNWDTSRVTNMRSMFESAYNFNQPLNNWDTSRVTSMKEMFSYATDFNQPLNNWDTSRVTNMQEMFWYHTTFNQDLSSWNVNAVTYCSYFDYRTDAWTRSKPSFSQCTP